mmetsp:Transcript_8979/g.20387  ORF Transcript_8979/g.20387 Transcript_8979/m.20387 type:complete len:201 (+) Transcript_8979:68-670(+)
MGSLILISSIWLPRRDDAKFDDATTVPELHQRHHESTLQRFGTCAKNARQTLRCERRSNHREPEPAHLVTPVSRAHVFHTLLLEEILVVCDTTPLWKIVRVTDTIQDELLVPRQARLARCEVAVAPRDDDDATTRRGDTAQLVHKLWLGRHMLAALHGPHEVVAPAVERHVHRVRNLKGYLVTKSSTRVQLISARRLPWT